MNRYLLAGLMVLSLGCSSPAGDSHDPLIIDLVEQWPTAEVSTETELIDIGTPEARVFLGQGWSWNEKGKSGTTFAWGSRHSSAIDFLVIDARALAVRFRCHPFRRNSGSVTAIEVLVNDHPIGDINLRPGWKEYEITIPASALQSGINRMAFHYRWEPETVALRPKRGARQVGVAWDWIRFPGMGGSEPRQSPLPEVLVLGSASLVDYYLAVPGEAFLVIDDLSYTGTLGGVEVSTQIEGAESPVVLFREVSETDLSSTEGGFISSEGSETGRSHHSFRWRLTESGGLVRVRFLVQNELELTRPRVEVVTASPDPTDVPDDSTVQIRRKDPSMVLLYVIDTLRADHLSVYGYKTETTPGLVQLMRDGVVFENAVANSSWTKPATASILTGLLPWSHGAEKSEDALTGSLTSLAAHLQGAGFQTGGFSANGNVSATFGFHHGFEEFSLMGRYDAPAAEVQGVALAWIAAQDSSHPIFLYIHTIDPHAPYGPTDRFFSAAVSGSAGDPVGTVPFMRQLAASKDEPDPALAQTLIEMYDSEIESNDHQFSQLLEHLKQSGLYDQALILVTSDHGEEFYDHGSWTHGRTLYQEMLHIPLLVKFPENWAAGTRVHHTVQHIDLLPTILDYLAIPPPPELQGRSLLCTVDQTSAIPSASCNEVAPRPVFASVHYHNNHRQSVLLDGWKLILRSADRLDRQAELFDLRVDPLERENLAGRYPIRVGYLTSLIRAELRSRHTAGGTQPVALDEETRQRLEALGYLN